MGYYTAYKLDVFVENPLEIIAELRRLSEDADYALDEEGDTGNNCKWYDHDNEMVNFSKLYPDVLFTLYSVGEESEDVWRAFYLDGQIEVQRARLVYDDPPEWVLNYA